MSQMLNQGGAETDSDEEGKANELESELDLLKRKLKKKGLDKAVEKRTAQQ